MRRNTSMSINTSMIRDDLPFLTFERESLDPFDEKNLLFSNRDDEGHHHRTCPSCPT